MKMNEEMREEMWYIVDYALGTLKYYEKAMNTGKSHCLY